MFVVQIIKFYFVVVGGFNLVVVDGFFVVLCGLIPFFFLVMFV